MTYAKFQAAIAASEARIQHLRDQKIGSDDVWDAVNKERKEINGSVRRMYRASVRGTVTVGTAGVGSILSILLRVRDESRLQESSWTVAAGEIDPACHHATDEERIAVRKTYEHVQAYTLGIASELPESTTDGRHPWTEPGYTPRVIP